MPFYVAACHPNLGNCFLRGNCWKLLSTCLLATPTLETAVACYGMMWHALSCCVMLCRAVSCYAMLCCVVSCCALSAACHVSPTACQSTLTTCHAVPCRASRILFHTSGSVDKTTHCMFSHSRWLLTRPCVLVCCRSQMLRHPRRLCVTSQT